MKQTSEKRYCAFCRSSRKVYIKRHLSAFDMFSCVIISLCLMYLFWQNFDPRFIAIFAVVFLLAELIVHMRHRIGIICRYCGFDPIVYAKNRPEAAARVRKHIEAHMDDPALLMSKQPIGELIIQYKKALHQGGFRPRSEPESKVSESEKPTKNKTQGQLLDRRF